jgi:hypothetical protein
MSGTVIAILCMTPAALLVLLMAMSRLEHLLLDTRNSIDGTPADSLAQRRPAPGEMVLGEPAT